MNPFNPEAGDVPAPSDPADVAVVEHSARVMWRAFPYFGWRYGERGRAFGRSDAGFLAALCQLEEEPARKHVQWLGQVLAPRGMPTLLLDVQLESLGRAAQRRRRPGATRLLALAAQLRGRRLMVLDPACLTECERMCRAAAQQRAERRGAGMLIAAAVADRALGMGAHDVTLVRWLSAAVPGESAWARACAAAHELALDRSATDGGRSP